MGWPLDAGSLSAGPLDAEWRLRVWIWTAEYRETSRNGEWAIKTLKIVSLYVVHALSRRKSHCDYWWQKSPYEYYCAFSYWKIGFTILTTLRRWRTFKASNDWKIIYIDILTFLFSSIFYFSLMRIIDLWIMKKLLKTRLFALRKKNNWVNKKSAVIGHKKNYVLATKHCVDIIILKQHIDIIISMFYCMNVIYSVDTIFFLWLVFTNSQFCKPNWFFFHCVKIKWELTNTRICEHVDMWTRGIVTKIDNVSLSFSLTW